MASTRDHVASTPSMWAPRESQRVFDEARAAARAGPPPKNAGDERRGHHAPHALVARGQARRGLADVSPLIASMPLVDSRATVDEPDKKPQKTLQIDSGAAARAIDSIGKHAKGRAASPPPLRTSPATRLRETSGASKKHDRDAASDEDDHNRESKRAEPDSSGESAVRLGLPDPSPPFDASPAVRTLDHTPSLASRVRS